MTVPPSTTPPAQPKPSGPKKKKKRKWVVDQGLATIVGAVIGVAGSLLVVHFTAASASPTSSASPATSASASPNAAASVTLNPPVNGDIKHQTSFSGHEANLQPGESVWTFFQVVEQKSGKTNPTTYPTQGPCVIDFSSKTWKCDNVYVGHVSDNETYQICPAILNFSQSATVVKLLANAAVDSALHNNSLVYWLASPPSYINPQTCTPAHRIN